ncbi:MAG: DNA-processing protein DprA [Acidimicrobiia bacterium]
MSALTAEQRAAATLACLPEMHPGRLNALLRRWGRATTALAAIHAGDGAVVGCLETPKTGLSAAQRLAARWRAVDPDVVGARCEQRGTRIWRDHDPGYPITRPVPHQPRVLLGEGRQLDVLAPGRALRVGIVGTRAATPSGRADTERLAAALAAAGVVVISGLAIGVDAAAHRGAIAAGGHTVAVVATGLDIVYPRRHEALARQVLEHGGILSESGFGVGPEPGRFPVRNRIIAALSDAVVVTEATERGGARITAEHALEYGRAVLAQPGSRRNPTAAGCNALIADGAHPLVRPSDVFMALDLDVPAGIDAVWSPDCEPPRTATATTVRTAMADRGASLDELLETTGLDAATLSAQLRSLRADGGARYERGRWWAT